MMKPRKNQKSRRQLLQSAFSLSMAPTFLTSTASAVASRSRGKIRVGVIGLGSRGFNLIDALLRQTDAQVTALCDVDTFHYRDQPWGKGRAYGLKAAHLHFTMKTARNTGPRLVQDFRDVCQSDDVDAVAIATPDHWHALMTLEAIRNGKDVYCEKPVTHTFAEGQQVCAAIEKHSTIFQTGSQQRSSWEFRQAVEIVRNGHLGQIKTIEVGLNKGYAKPQGDTTVQEPPKTLDYDLWCGPASKLPYMRARHHRWWRGHRAFGGGVLMDWIGHHNDIAHWAMNIDAAGPTQVEATGWTFPESPVYNTPHEYEIRCEYASGIQTSIASRFPNGVKFVGEDGWLFVTRGRITASDERFTVKGFDVGSERVYKSDNHMQNFLECIRSRKACLSPAATTHRSITPGHLGYVSHALQRPLKWDPATESIPDDSEAMELLLQNDYRSPWK